MKKSPMKRNQDHLKRWTGMLKDLEKSLQNRNRIRNRGNKHESFKFKSLLEQYTCWNCGLLQGDPDSPHEESTLCPACKKAGVK